MGRASIQPASHSPTKIVHHGLTQRLDVGFRNHTLLEQDERELKENILGRVRGGIEADGSPSRGLALCILCTDFWMPFFTRPWKCIRPIRVDTPPLHLAPST